MDETHNSLEDWIAFKTDIFNDVNNKSDRLCFLVAFNDIENTFAITCIESTRRANDRRQKSMASSLSLQNLVNINQQLSLVRPEVDQYFRVINDFIEQQNSTSRLFTLIFGYGPKKMVVSEDICLQIQHYLETALLLCGRKLLLAVLFDIDFLADFEENIQELRLKGFENILNNTMKELNEAINLRTKAETLLQISTIYEIEDLVIANVSIALAELYNFQLQPFLQLRELSYNDMNKAKQILNNLDLGERVKKDAQKELKESKEQYLSSTEALQQLYQEYYRKTVELVSGQTDRMRFDQNRFGVSAFEVKGALTRLQKLELFLSQEKLKLLNSIKMTKEFQRDQVQEQMNDNHSDCDLQRIENEVYEVQISVLDSKLDIIFEEEILLKKKIAILETNMQNEENSEFFDAIEDVEELENFNLNPKNISPNDCNKLASLKTKLNNLFRKRAFLRNKRISLLSEKKSRVKKTTVERENFERHHKQQNRRSFRLNERKDDQKLKEIRRQTLLRLKNYKLKALLYENCDLSDGNEDNLPLPPYPKSNNNAFDGHKELPLPPPQNYLNDIELAASAQSLSIDCVPTPPSPPPPPPPPPPSVPPPPPPPPPSLFTSFQSPKLDLKLKKRDPNNCVTSETQTKKGFSGLIDLNEILKMKNKLKPTQVRDTVNDMNCPQNSLLHATLNRIRTIVEDSDISEDDSNSEQEFD